jgi:hypothetical protein
MKKFYVTKNGDDLHFIPKVSSNSSPSLFLKGNIIYYLHDYLVDGIEGNAGLIKLFRNDEFNSLNENIPVEALIETLPVTPVDLGWYLVSSISTDSILKDYDNALAYYDSSDTKNPWKFLLPMNGLSILLNGDIFKYDAYLNTKQDTKWTLVKSTYHSIIFDKLVAPGATIGVETWKYNTNNFQFTILTINTSVTVRIEISNDNLTWVNVDPNDNDIIKTTNGTYAISVNIPGRYMRFVFVSEVGGTDATIDVNLFQNNPSGG